MSPKSSGRIPVVDVDQAFPTLVGPTGGSQADQPFDHSPQVRAAIRDVLGVRSRTEDPQAFTDSLTAAFRLVPVEGHVEAQFVPRGYAIQADLGAVTGGQASLYRRATISRAEILRILDGLTPLRVDGDTQDMDAYRSIVRNAVQSLVDELGAPGGPRVAMVETYLAGLLGTDPDQGPDTIGGQLGALRDRFGLVDDNVNTVEEEGLRTAFWTLVDMVRDLHDAWGTQSSRFGGGAGAGFLGTELIHISRLMEAASDQVDELESVFDSVLLPQSERQTIRLSDEGNLTLDGLLTWLHDFLSDEGRRLAQDAGRDGIVAALAPTTVELARTVREFLLSPIARDHDDDDHYYDFPFVRYLRSGAFRHWPHGMFSARVEIAVSGLSRLLTELARRAQRIGRFAGIVLIEAELAPLDRDVVVGAKAAVPATTVDVRGMNVRPQQVLCFVWGTDAAAGRRGTQLTPLLGSATADDDTLSGVFDTVELTELLDGYDLDGLLSDGTVRIPASYLPLAVLDTETGRIVHAPRPTTWPHLYRADRPRAPIGTTARKTNSGGGGPGNRPGGGSGGGGGGAPGGGPGNGSSTASSSETSNGSGGPLGHYKIGKPFPDWLDDDGFRAHASESEADTGTGSAAARAASAKRAASPSTTKKTTVKSSAKKTTAKKTTAASAGAQQRGGR